MTIHFIVSFIADKENGRPDGKLRMRVRWGKDNRVAVNLGYRVTLSKWNKESQRCVANTIQPKRISSSEINAEIQRYEKAAEDTFRAFERRSCEPSVDEYRTALRNALGRDKRADKTGVKFLSAEYIRIKSAEASWSEITTLNHRSIFKRICESYPSLKISEMATERWLKKYIADLVETGIKNTTIKDRVAFVRTFVIWCAKNGYAESEEVKEYKPKFKIVPRTVVWLTWDELMRFNSVTIDTSDKKGRKMQLAKDLFGLSCFTGLRISDLIRLKWTDIDEGGIRIVLQKTSKPVLIELNKHSRAIVDRLRLTPDNIFPEYVFSRSCKDKNLLIDNIREIAKRAGIDEPSSQVYYIGGVRHEETKPKYERLSMHCGRRTFICNALEMGIPPQVVMGWTGHSNYDAMKPYIAISDKAKKKAMKKFDK